MPKRTRHTVNAKIAIARKAMLPINTISAVARAEGLPESTVRGWVNGIKQLEDLAINSDHASNSKHVRSEKTPTLTGALKMFCEAARKHKPPMSLTAQMISIKAAEISARHLVALRVMLCTNPFGVAVHGRTQVLYPVQYWRRLPARRRVPY